MKKTKLFELLSGLGEGEWARLDDFLASPYWNEDEELLRLFRTVRQYWTEIRGGHLSKQALYRSFVPSTAYRAKWFNYRLSDLNRLTESFLATERWQREGRQKDLLLLDELSARGVKKNYAYHHRRLGEALALSEIKHFRDYEERARFAAVEERHFERERLRQFDENLQRAGDELDRYYYLHRLNYSCGMLDRQTIFRDHYDPGISEEWLTHLRSRPIFADPLIKLYHNILLALREEDDESHFDRLRASILRYRDASPSPTMRAVYLFAINYCARKIRRDRSDYLAAALDLYLEGIRGGFLLEREELSPWTFTNVCKLMLRLKRYAEVEEFIDQFADRLPGEFRENAEHYNRAELYYHTDRLEEAQHHLTQVAYSDLNYYLGARVLLTKIFFETEAEEALLAILASFTIFLKRNKKISADIKAAYLNFCQLMLRILRLGPGKRTGLLDKIQSTQPLTDREWLLKIGGEMAG